MFRLFAFILFALFLIAFSPAFAQTDKNLKTDTTRIFCEIIDQQPEFPGGIEAMFIHLNERTKGIDLTNKPEGMVVIGFTVTKTGTLSNIKLLKTLDKELDQTALDIVKEMPAWAPGMNDGKAIDVAYTLPIRFSKETGKIKKKVKSKN